MTDELAERGLYDPEAPDAPEQLALVRLALDHGAGDEEIREARAAGRLHVVAVERLLLGGTERLTFDELVERAGVEPDFAERAWRALGLVVPEAGAPECTDADLATLRFFAQIHDLFGITQTLATARTTGASTARMADSIVANARSLLEAPVRSGGGGNVEVAQAFMDAAQQVVPNIYPMVEAVHRRQLVQAARRYQLWGGRPTEESTIDAVVGFADLVGFTSLGQQLSTIELDRLVATLEERALEAVARPGARLVKLIGDEALFVTGSARDAVAIATALLGDPELPPMSAGLAAGQVVVREGDLYGPTVNLAARLVGVAEPDTLLMDAETAARLGSSSVTSLGTRELAGIDEPVEVFGLVS